MRPNIICRVCAFISACTIGLPWLVRQSYTIHSRYQDWFVSIAGPDQYYSLLEMAAQSMFDTGGFPVPYPLAVFALVFVVGIVIAFFTPVAGLLQVASVYAIAAFMAQSNFILVDIPVVTAEYGLGIGFHIGFAASLGVVFSLSASATDFVLRPFKVLYSKMKPSSHGT